jgi:putative polyhydroxyalkanoate system protein
MSEIRMVRRHSLTLKQAKAAAQKAADKLAQEYELKSEWDGDTLRFERSGVSGEMHVTDSEIDLTVKLGLLLRPFKAKLEEQIDANLSQALVTRRAGKSGKQIT